MTLLPIARGVIRPLLAAAAATAACAMVRELIPDAGFVQLSATGVVGLATYALLVVPAEQRRQLITKGRERLGALRARPDMTPAVAERRSRRGPVSRHTCDGTGEVRNDLRRAHPS